VSVPDLERLRAIFGEEAAERLDRLTTTLLALDAGDAATEATDAIFRDVHSLKGGAGLVGLDELHAIAHAVEELLSAPRAARRPLPRAAAEPLLGATDAMRRAAAGEADVAAAALARLPATLDAVSAADQPSAADAPSADVPPAGAASPASDAPPAGDAPAAAAPAAPPPPATPGVLDASVRVSVAKVDRVLDTVGGAVLHQRGLEHLLAQTADDRVEEALSQGELLLDDLQDAALDLRALPLSAITGAFPRFVRDLSRAEGKEVELTLHGVETQLDRAILDGLSDMLVHVLRNAIAHGLESPQERADAGKPPCGRIELRAEQRAGGVAIAISDDGRGVAPELLAEAEQAGSLVELLARPGFSTAQAVSDVAGRGVGLDAVKSHVESLGGGLEASSEPGRGMTVTLLLPFTLAILQVLLVERLGQPFAFPLASVAEVVSVEQTHALERSTSIELRGRAIPLGDLAGALGAAGELPERPPALVLNHAGASVALACDRLLGEEEVVMQGLGPLLEQLPGYLGGTILGDGRIALVVDPVAAVSGAAGTAGAAGAAAGALAVGGVPAVGAGDENGPAPSTILVVDDQFTVRELQRSILEAAGYRVVTATDGRDALARLDGDDAIDLVVTDLEMPELDGLGLVRRIREQEATSTLPVIVVTSLVGEDDRRRGLDAGADAYVTKDRFDQRALLDTVEQLVGG
jgi:two-component system chemotaxis sensor kinase CheA